MPTVISERCGKGFNKKPSQIAKVKHHYCSMECRRRPSRVCQYCGTTYAPKDESESKFCGLTCYHSSRKDQKVSNEIKCESCGKNFYRSPAHAARYSHQYCSTTCAGNSQRGRLNHNWNGGHELRNCEVCGTEYSCKPRQKKRTSSRSCSQELRDRSLIPKKIQLECQGCKSIYFKQPSLATESKFCSKECFDISHAGEVHQLTCSFCQIQYTGVGVRGINRVYCSKDC